MVGTATIKSYEVHCSNCGKLLKPNEDVVIQLRTGYVDENGEFFPKEDFGYYCNECE